MTRKVLIVIPTLNEASHLGAVLDGLADFARQPGVRLVVVDGGSTDGTCAVAASRNVPVLPNPKRIQSSGVNLAVVQYGDGVDWLIRIDAHSTYPPDYCRILLSEALQTEADAVVVSMVASGKSWRQKAIAAAQNSVFGNGGSAHRMATDGAFVEHGHHALMRLSSFRAAGGYDERFRHNEDAELDYRLTKSGNRIWLTPLTRVTYYPRDSIAGLARQYYNFGRGRAQSMIKHGWTPRLRQTVVILLAPLLLLCALYPIHPVFAAPALFWLLACLFAGLTMKQRTGPAAAFVAGLSAGTMHVAWSVGYWSKCLTHLSQREVAVVK